MVRFLLGMLCLSLVARAAAPPFSFQNRYIPLGTRDVLVAVVSDAADNVFIVSSRNDIAPPASIRVIKIDPDGNVLRSFDFAPGVRPVGGAVDRQGNVLIAGRGGLFKLDNGLTTVLAS